MKAFVLASLLVGAVSFAQSKKDGSPSKPAPAHEATDACGTKSRGDTCAFVSRKSENVEGKCSAPSGKPLTCKPSEEKTSHE